MKRAVGDLALFGGQAAFLEPLYVGRPSLGDRKRFLERVCWALDNRWLTNGPLVREFEQRVAELCGVRNCVTMCNATTALHLLYLAVGLSAEVIMPSMTYVATAHAARLLGITPVFCDVDPATGCLDPQQVEAALTPRTTGVVSVHLWGRPSHIEELEKIATRHRLRLVFDAAHALGCSYRGRKIGGFGDAEVFSFHATKVVNSFEGGAVVTDDDDLAEKLRSLRTFGVGSDGQVGGVGVNAKMSEASAAMGLTSLDAFEQTVGHNRANHARYRSELRGIEGIEVVGFDEDETPNWQYVIVKIDKSVTGIHRDTLQHVLKAENVVAQRYFSPGCHQLEPYHTERPIELPLTEALSEQVLALPTGPATSGEEVSRVCEIIRCGIRHGQVISDRLHSAGR